MTNKGIRTPAYVSQQEKEIKESQDENAEEAELYSGIYYN